MISAGGSFIFDEVNVEEEAIMREAAIISAGVLLLSVLAFQPVCAQDVKIGYIDTGRIFAEFEETVEAEQVFQKEVEVWKKQREEMETALAALREEIESQSLMLSEEKLAEKKLILEQNFNDYQKFLQETFGEDGKVAKRNEELTQPIVEKINRVIAQIAEDEGYTIVLDAAQGNIVFASKEIDLTEKVLERLEQLLETVE